MISILFRAQLSGLASPPGSAEAPNWGLGTFGGNAAEKQRLWIVLGII